jgi:hypothetical protein
MASPFSLSTDSGYSVLSGRKFHIQLERSMNGVVTFSNQWLPGWRFCGAQAALRGYLRNKAATITSAVTAFGTAIGVTLLLGYVVGRSRQRRAKAGSSRDCSGAGDGAMPEATMPGAAAEAINAVHGGKPRIALCASAAGLLDSF